MMGQMSTAQCCCTNCEDCCNGHEPTEFDADITLSDSDCDTCDSFVSGVYNLAKSGPCRWLYTSGFFTSQYCRTPYPSDNDKITGVDVSLLIRCVSDTQYRLYLDVSVSRRYDTGTEVLYGFPMQTRNYFGLDVYRFESTAPFTEFRCDEASDYELTLVSKTATRVFEFFNLVYWQFVNFTAPADATTKDGWTIDYHCDPTTVLITAVP